MSKDPTLKLAVNALYGQLGNASGTPPHLAGVVAMTLPYAAKNLPQKVGAMLSKPLDPDLRDRSIEEAVCIARDMLPEPTLLNLDLASYPQATRAAELIIRTVMPGAWFEVDAVSRLLRARPDEYVEAAVAVIHSITVPNTVAFMAHETAYFVTALNAWALRDDERFGIDLKAPWRRPYPVTETRVAPEVFMGALAAWPSRLLEPEASRSLAEELADLDRELEQMERSDG
jgi:hypothetical protein